MTRSGQLAGVPPRGPDIALDVVIAAVLAPALLTVLLLFLGAVACRALDWHRLASWDAAWRAAEPG